MADIFSILKSIINDGAGLILLAVLIYGVIMVALKAPKAIDQWKNEQSKQRERQLEIEQNSLKQYAIATEVIRTNSGFMEQMAKSNDNITKVLEMIAPSYKETADMLKEHDIRSQKIMVEITKISERTGACRLKTKE